MRSKYRDSKIPSISSASDNMNIVMAINLGADDFIPKPFDLSVLLAKVQAALRRAYDYQGQSTLMEHRGMLFNSLDCTVTYEGKQAELTKNEARILWCLMRKELCTRDELIEDLWTNGMYIDGNTLYVNIGRLREKLAAIGADGFIRTVRGVGYRL